MKYTPIISGAEPFFFPGGPTGCLLVHGFTGAPKEMRQMGQYLSKHGCTVLGVRLSGHATKPEDLNQIRWMDWLRTLEDGWCILSDALNIHSSPKGIFLAGLSTGGILSLLFASGRYTGSKSIRGVICMSTPYALREDWRLSYIKVLRYLQPYVPKGEPDWHDPHAAEGHIEYPVYPTKPIVELRDLLAEMRTSLPDISVPALLMHAHGDTGGGFFDPESMQKIHADLGSIEKEMVWIEESGHNMVCDRARNQVFQTAQSFISQIVEADE